MTISSLIKTAPQTKQHFLYAFIGLCFWFLLFQDKFFSLLSPRTYTGWDTHAFGFVNFLYFTDALKSGSIPLWNPFMQSGSFFPNFFNVGLYYPFELLFVFLAWFINPLLSYELLIQVTILIGAVGMYLLFCHWRTQGYLAFIGALLYAIIILSPLVGQIWYTVSFSSLPWLLLICSYLSTSKTSVRPAVWMSWAMLYLFFMVGGYFWLNLMNFLLAFCFSSLLLWGQQECQGRKVSYKTIFRIFLCKSPIYFLMFAGAIYICAMLPGLLNFQFNYNEFFGDFVSPEGRLRGLKVHGAAGYGGALETLIGNIDPLISQNQPWWKEGGFNYGAGWALWIAFLVSLSLQWGRRQIFWLAAMMLAIVYSAGSDTVLGSILMRIPVINGNRYWLGVGTSYASVFLLLMVISKFELIAQGLASGRVMLIRTIFVLVAVCAFLYFIYAPKIEYVFVVVSCLCMALFCVYRLRLFGKLALLGIACLSTLYVIFTPYRAYSNPALLDSYRETIVKRQPETSTVDNHRMLDLGTEFNYFDAKWLYQKKLFNHGYNHFGNPRYWYVKNNPFLDKIVVVTQSARTDTGIQRGSFNSDNEYAESIGREVLSHSSIPIIEASQYSPIVPSKQFTYEISDLIIKPNNVSFEVQVNAPAHIIFNMLYVPGWSLKVNGDTKKAYQANYLFQGFDILVPGTYLLEYSYRPYLQIFLLIIPYVMLLILAFVLILGGLPKKKSQILK